MARPRSHPEIGEDILRDLYERRQLSIPDVACLTGLAPRTVWRRLVEYGIPTRHPGLPGAAPYTRAEEILTPDALNRWAAEGLSVTEMGRRTGFGDQTVMRYLRGANIPVASRESNGRNRMDAALGVPRTKAASGGSHRAHPEIGEAVLRELYEQRGLSVGAVANQTGLASTTVWRRLAEYRIPTRRSSPTAKPQPYARPADTLTPALLEQLAVQDGLSASEIGRRTGFARDRVIRYLRAAGLPVLPPGIKIHHRSSTDGMLLSANKVPK